MEDGSSKKARLIKSVRILSLLARDHELRYNDRQKQSIKQLVGPSDNFRVVEFVDPGGGRFQTVFAVGID